MEIKFKKMDEQAIMPTYGTEFAAGADLRILTTEPITIQPHETVKLRTGIAVEIPYGMVGLVYSRSGIACKRGLTLANNVGVIDSDYRGEIMVFLHNEGTQPQTVEPAERVAQLVISPYYKCNFIEVDDLEKTDRGTGGFGSTGRI